MPQVNCCTGFVACRWYGGNAAHHAFGLSPARVDARHIRIAGGGLYGTLCTPVRVENFVGFSGKCRVASRHYMRQPLLPHNEGEGALISELHLVADGGVVVGVGSVQLCVHIHEEAV